MAALDTPWLSFGSPSMSARDDTSLGGSPPTQDTQTATGAPPTFAAFSPVTLSANTPSRSSRRSTILVHQKSPLLLATPPQITRALAYSHPFLLPLNSFVGLLTWSTGDPWESFLLLCAFWGVVLYGDIVLRWAGPVVVGAGLILGMYGRRFSPLSSSGWREPARGAKDLASKFLGVPGSSATQANASASAAPENQPKHQRGNSEVTNTKHQKTLDEIVDTLREFTGRCNVLLEPLLEMTDFLSTQRTPTSATTRPALIAMFMRLLVVTPFWFALSMPPWRIITTKRVMLVAGTLTLTWHSKISRVSRTILWRSATVRHLATIITGLPFETPKKPVFTAAKDQSSERSTAESELTKALQKSRGLHLSHRRGGSAKSAGVKFTFILYENQRRWVGLGWTNSLFAYERAAWTDEHNNAVSPKEDFELPEVEEGAHVRWRWVEGSRWRVDGVPDEHGTVDYDGEEARNGWVYYDNKWQYGRRGQDGWGRWTRRRKWYRDAELVEVDEADPKGQADEDDAKSLAPSMAPSTYGEKMVAAMRSEPALPLVDDTVAGETDAVSNNRTSDDSMSVHSTSASSRSFFRPGSFRLRPTNQSMPDKEKDVDRPTRASVIMDEEEGEHGLSDSVDLALQQRKEVGDWGIADEARMNLE
ncbi:hypothetical protein NLU13_4343 [Sarocladium strictum]|uniref:Peroxin/Ferlin domain-containing protein n=1 Tax=Sarocladium strictum TaxID=5046 RepID=A0AA39L8T9_SARSR|nr:hypothetical protein NLU13_4343 [Sarocladium strictum]